MDNARYGLDPDKHCVFFKSEMGNDNNNVVILPKSGCCEYQQNNIYSSHYSKYCFVDSYSL
jgi:hypothetical protein